MIIVRIHGGLGNQMFQYALGRTLSLLQGVPFKIDSSYLQQLNQSNRVLEIGNFNTLLNEATPEEIGKYTSTFQKILDRLRPYPRKKKIIELRGGFDARILDLSEGYFDGHWTYEHHFSSHQKEIREDFTLKAPLGIDASEIAKKIAAEKTSVSVHIRRGDYVSIGKVATKLGTLPLSYYEKALAFITERFSDAHFFIFSDDIEWAKEHLPKKYPLTFVSKESISNPEDMYLMSICTHNIIANSTFSWWGAWLNQNPHKIVITPAQWHRNQDLDTPGLIPSSWKQL